MSLYSTILQLFELFLFFQFQNFGKSSHRFIDDRFTFRDQHILVQVSEGEVCRAHDITFMGCHFPCNDLEEGGFTRAIAAYESDAFAGFNHKIDTVEQDSITVLDINIRQIEHSGRKGNTENSCVVYGF